MDVHELAARFEGAKRRGPDSYMVKCPCHQDTKPSLGISEKDGKLLLNCFAGCDTRDILGAVGLTLADLCASTAKADFGGPEDRLKEALERWKGKALAALYPYQDERGRELYRKARFVDKDMAVIVADRQAGAFKAGRCGAPATLYRLPGLLAAVQAGETVFYVEGEKDADTLAGLGLTATTAGGANDWRKEYAAYFQGASVVILPDNDEAGQKLAQAVARDLGGVAAAVKVVPTSKAPHGDVTDWLGEGHTKEEFLKLCGGAGGGAQGKLETISAKRLMGMRFRALMQPVEGLICEGLTFLVAPSKTGKSWLSLLLALCVASGVPFLQRRTTRCRVVYLALEDSLRRIQSRLRTLEADEPPENLLIATKAHLLGEGLEDQFDSWLKEDEGPALIIIDVFQKVRGASDKWKNAYQNDYEVVGALKRIADKHRAAIVCVHHTNKLRNVTDPFEKISGSTGIMGAADTVILLDRQRGEDTATVRYQGRDVWGDDFVIRFVDGKWELVSNSAAAYTEREEYEANPLVQLFRKLVSENPQGGKWPYSQLYREGLSFLGYAPFTDARDCAAKIKQAGLDTKLIQYDGILVTCGVQITKGEFKGKGVKLEARLPQTVFQTKIVAPDISGSSCSSC